MGKNQYGIFFPTLHSLQKKSWWKTFFFHAQLRVRQISFTMKNFEPIYCSTFGWIWLFSYLLQWDSNTEEDSLLLTSVLSGTGLPENIQPLLNRPSLCGMCAIWMCHVQTSGVLQLQILKLNYEEHLHFNTIHYFVIFSNYSFKAGELSVLLVRWIKS